MSEMDLDQICDISIGQLKRLGIDVPKEKIILEEVDSHAYRMDTFKDGIKGLSWEEMIKCATAFELSGLSSRSTAGVANIEVDSEGHVSYRITLIKNPRFDSPHPQLNDINKVAKLSHEFGHIWEYENSMAGKKFASVVISMYQAKHELDDLFEQFRIGLDDFKTLNPLRSTDPLSLHIEQLVRDQDENRDLFISTKAALKQFRELYGTSLILKEAKVSQALAVHSHRCNISQDSDRESYALDAVSQKVRKMREDEEKERNLNIQGYQAQVNKIREVLEIYRRIESVAVRYIDLISKVKEVKNESEVISEGWAQYLAAAASRNYRKDIGLENLPIGWREMKKNYLQQIAELEDELAGDLPDEERRAIEYDIGTIEIQMVVVSDQENRSRSLLKPYEEGLDLYEALGSFEAAKNAATSYTKDDQLRIAVNPQFEIQKPEKPKGRWGFLKGIGPLFKSIVSKSS